MSAFLDLVQIILIDLSLAADNALVVGMAVAALPVAQRRRAMIVGIGAATALRILLAFFAAQLLQIAGLLAAGGFLLLWVGWKMARDIHAPGERGGTGRSVATQTHQAIRQIVIADISMSLDNVLGVAGVARDHRGLLAVGLVLSVLLMGLASSRIAALTARFPKLGYIGVAVIFYTASRMIDDGLKTIHAFV